MKHFLTLLMPALCATALFADIAIADELAVATEPAATAVTPADPGDVAWMLVASAFVLLMTCPGLALFYGGLVRKKNILGVMMQCVFLMGLMSVYWGVFGYSWAFGGDSRWCGGFKHVFLNGIMPAQDAIRMLPSPT